MPIAFNLSFCDKRGVRTAAFFAVKRMATVKKSVSEHFKRHFHYLHTNIVQQETRWLIVRFLLSKVSEPWQRAQTVTRVTYGLPDSSELNQSKIAYSFRKLEEEKNPLVSYCFAKYIAAY